MAVEVKINITFEAGSPKALFDLQLNNILAGRRRTASASWCFPTLDLLVHSSRLFSTGRRG